jgi:hypothetical protein
LQGFDQAFSHFGWYRSNLIRLVWGFEMPAGPVAAQARQGEMATI